jgi:hypothetical protein
MYKINALMVDGSVHLAVRFPALAPCAGLPRALAGDLHGGDSVPGKSVNPTKLEDRFHGPFTITGHHEFTLVDK